MYNKVVMVGNLTKDMELRYLPSGLAVGKNSIATSYRYKSATGEQKDEVCFLDLSFFGRSAEIANQYLRKGSKVLVEGRLVLEQWTGQDGSNRSKHTLRVDVMKMLDSKTEQAQNPNDYNQPYSAQSHNQGQQQPQTSYNQGQQQPQTSYNQGQQQPQTSYNQGQYQHEIPEIEIDDEIPY